MEALALPETEDLAPRPEVPPDGVWVFAEQRRGELAPVTAELLGEARRLAEVLGVKVAAVLLGDGVAPWPRLSSPPGPTRSIWRSTRDWPISWKRPMPRP